MSLALFALLFLATTLQAQNNSASSTPAAGATPTPTPVDPGPRPVGTVSAKTICPVTSAKFPGAPACTDIVQPAGATGTGAGNILASPGNLAGLWFQGLTVFEAEATVTPTSTSAGLATIGGLGPSFNAVSCFQCHSQPAVGGSSPNTSTPGFSSGNPQVGDATLMGADNSLPSFIPSSGSGPVREARFPKAVAATTDTAGVLAGAVANLFVIQNRTDAPSGCVIDQIDFQTQQTNSNIIFRIPIPTFGDGFVEAVPDATLASNLATAQSIANNTKFFNPALGIKGTFNRSGNDQSITRFGWKAQNKSLLVFAGEASNVEMGVTNELFTNERTIGNGDCTPNNSPEDVTAVLASSNTATGANAASEISANIENFAVFMRLNAPPAQCDFASGVSSSGSAQCNALSASAKRGAVLFGTMAALQTAPSTPFSPTNPAVVGCVLCHTDTLTTGPSTTPSLSNASFQPFSDFAVHTMDASFADGVTQGSATGQQFRSAPLWGAGQRLFFLHDGSNGSTDFSDESRTPAANALYNTIEAHCANPSPSSGTTASEACNVIAIFNALPATTPSGSTTPSQQDLLNFLRSL